MTARTPTEAMMEKAIPPSESWRSSQPFELASVPWDVLGRFWKVIMANHTAQPTHTVIRFGVPGAWREGHRGGEDVFAFV